MTQDNQAGALGDPAMPVDPGQEPVDGVPPDIAEAVRHVANRYGTRGLEDLIAAARKELGAAEQALQDLAD